MRTGQGGTVNDPRNSHFADNSARMGLPARMGLLAPAARGARGLGRWMDDGETNSIRLNKAPIHDRAAISLVSRAAHGYA